MQSRKSLIALAMAATLPTSGSADTVLYGKMWATMNAINDDVAHQEVRDDYELVNNSSRLGVQGSTKLTDTLNAIYKAEYEIALDGDDYSADGNVLKQRNIYVGLQGGFGTLIAGKHDTPTKLAQAKVDRFNDYYYGDMRHVFVGDNRENDIVMYTTPKFSGFAATVSFQPGENSATDDDNISDYASAALSYTNDVLYLALAGDSNLDSDGKGTDILRAVVDYKIGPFTVGGMYQTAEQHGNSSAGIGKFEFPLSSSGLGGSFEEQEGYLLSGEYSINKWKLKGQWAQSESDELNGLGDVEATQWSIGLDYKLGDKTVLQSYYTDLKAEENYSVPSDDAESDTFGMGIQHDF